MLKDHALNMLTEAVQDGGQAMRDPVGGSVEFHFVPILKLISTLLIMGVFDDNDVKHILKLIEPSVFSDGESQAEKLEATKIGDAEQLVSKEEGIEVKEKAEKVENENEGEQLDEGMGEDEEEDLEEEEEYEQAGKEGEDEHAAEKTDREKATDGEAEKETDAAEAEVKEEEDVGEGLLHMKLPESVKLQVKYC